MSKPSSSSSYLLVSTLTASTALLLYKLYTHKTSKALESEDESSYITPNLVCQFFDGLFVQMQAVLANLSQQIAQIQAAGQRIPEAQLRQLITAEFERALGVKQQQALEELDVDEECMQEAMEAYLKQAERYPSVVKSVERFRKLYDTVSGNDSAAGSTSSVELLSAQKV